MILGDTKEIDRILSDDDIVKTFFRAGEYGSPEGENIFYLFSDGCLFPSVKHGKTLSIHAAVLKKYRGRIAVNAAKKVICWAFDGLGVDRVVARTSITSKNVWRFAEMVGLKFSRADENYRYYEATRWTF